MEPVGAERHRRSPEGELAGASESIEPARRKKASLSNETERNIEAGAGIEPANSGFADRDLTTWLPRRLARADNIVVGALVSTRESFRSQAPSIETHVFAATTASAPGQPFNASTNPVIVSG
jgi:hypothetical protein